LTWALKALLVASLTLAASLCGPTSSYSARRVQHLGGTAERHDGFSRHPSACQPNALYTLVIANGAQDGTARISSARIAINGVNVVGRPLQPAGCDDRAIRSALDGHEYPHGRADRGASNGRVALSIRRTSTFANRSSLSNTSRRRTRRPSTNTSLPRDSRILSRSSFAAAIASGGAQIKSAVVTLNGKKIVDGSDCIPA